MKKTSLRALTGALCLMAATAGAEPTYTLTLKSGKIPADVKVENANGVAPDPTGYNRGWTENGWTADRFGDRGSVLLSPTYNAGNEECENILTLPMIEIEESSFLRWDARSVLPDRPEAYTVEIRPEGEEAWTVLESIQEEKGMWWTRMSSLDDYAGRRAELRFVARTAKGFMLALDKVSVGAAEGTELICLKDNTDRFYGRHSKNGKIRVTALNAGAESWGEIGCRIEGGSSSTMEMSGSGWSSGEETELEFTPHINTGDLTDGKGEVKYTVYCATDDGEVIISEGSIYCSNYRITPLIDKGTGMWCNNCPAGVLNAESLKQSFGDGIIIADAHVDDVLSTGYSDHLGFRAVPYFRVNRDAETGGSSLAPNLSKLAGDSDGNVEIGINDMTLSADQETLSVTAEVKSMNGIDNTTDRYRIGYVVTADIHDEENLAYYQENNCKMVNYDQYFYLPTYILSPLAYFHDVALTEEGAFDGLAGSLPASIPGAFPEMTASSTYTWEIRRPGLLDDFKRGRVAAYILDTETGHILNATAARVDSFSGTEGMEGEHARPAAKGIYRMDGTKVGETLDRLPAGLYIVDGKKTVVKK